LILILILIIFIWNAIYLLEATKLYLSRNPLKHEIFIFKGATHKEQVSVVFVLAELLNSGLDPNSAINSSLNIVPRDLKNNYLNPATNFDDFLANSIQQVQNSAINGTKISETLKLNLVTLQRHHRSVVLKQIKKSEVWLLGPLGLCFLPTFMLVAVVPLIGSLITGFIN
jgi:type II secretory pathway component PulF